MSIAEVGRPSATRQDMGWLANNGMFVKSLQSSLSQSEGNARTVPGLFEYLTQEDGWQQYVFVDNPDHVYTWDAAAFRDFIESPRSEGGCQTPLHVLERMLRDTDAWPTFLELTRGEPGDNAKDQDRGDHGRFKPRECDNIILPSKPPATIPIPPNRKPPTGTSTSYALRQLERGKTTRDGIRLPARPDLLARVQAGEITPWAAILEAGYRTATPNLPRAPDAAVRVIVRHFRGEALEELIRGLANWAGIELAGPSRDDD